MPLIDGIGDEVMQFGITVAVTIVAVLAWWSTNARPDRYRAVIQMHNHGHSAVTVSIRTRQGARITRTRNSAIQFPIIADASPPTSSSSNPMENRVIPLQEMDSIVDADMAMMDNNRLHFYRRVPAPVNVQSTEEAESASEGSDTVEEPESEPPSSAQIREMDSIVSAMEADLAGSGVTENAINNNDVSSTLHRNENATVNKPKVDKVAASDAVRAEAAAGTAGPVGDADTSAQRKILIKLKYINDTLKEVEGSLDEPLKDFKCRHFSAELRSCSRVRLIFNGRALLDEAATLRACGLHHRAVVHCLVQPGRAGSRGVTGERTAHRANPAHPTRTQAAPVHEVVTAARGAERYWDLENILMTLVSLALTVVWFFRCEYSNMFTASASVALFGLTVFYSVAIFALYLSDTFQFERRAPTPPANPVPPN